MYRVRTSAHSHHGLLPPTTNHKQENHGRIKRILILRYLIHFLAKSLIFHRDGFFFITSSRSWIGIRKKILLLSHLTYPFWGGGYFSKMLGYLRHARWNGGWISFVSNSKAFFDGINRLFHAHGTCISRTNNSCTTPRE